MAKKKKAKVLVGNYVRVKKGLLGVVTGFEANGTWNKKGEWVEVAPVEAYVATVDEYGNDDNNIYAIKKLTKIKAPDYCVVWTDAYSDPMCQFESKAEADKFAAKLRKDKHIVEVRIYKLIK